jgi:hypothetical protein
VVEQFQTSGQLLWTTAKQCDDLEGTEKTMPVNEPDDVTVAFRELYGGNGGRTFEARKAGLHPSTVSKNKLAK